MNPVILFRHDRTTIDEFEIAKSKLQTVDLRSKVPENSLVIGRYSVLPFYKELEEDLLQNGSQLINSYRQHRYIADLSSWYGDFCDITPKTWFNLHEIPNNGPFILKGETNSRKFSWKTHMFAENKVQAGEVHSRLLNDSMIGTQNIVIRQYVPLKTFDYDFSGLPITEEYRFFILNGKVISGAYYWSSYYDDLIQKGEDINPNNVPKEFIDDVIERVGGNSNFYVVDIARTKEPYNPLYNIHGNGNWIVVELNDGQMSGLSMNDPDNLYQKIKESFCC